MQETWVWFLGWKDPLEDGMVIHSSILAWRALWTEEPGGLQAIGLQRVVHDWATKHSPVGVSDMLTSSLGNFKVHLLCSCWDLSFVVCINKFFAACFQDSQVALVVNNLPANAGDTETQVWSSGQEVPLEENMATHSRFLGSRILWTEETGGLQSVGRWTWLKRLGTHAASPSASAGHHGCCHRVLPPWCKKLDKRRFLSLNSKCLCPLSTKLKWKRERDLPICFWVYYIGSKAIFSNILISYRVFN